MGNSGSKAKAKAKAKAEVKTGAEAGAGDGTSAFKEVCETWPPDTAFSPPSLSSKVPHAHDGSALPSCGTPPLPKTDQVFFINLNNNNNNNNMKNGKLNKGKASTLSAEGNVCVCVCVCVCVMLLRGKTSCEVPQCPAAFYGGGERSGDPAQSTHLPSPAGP
ncbi:hypothetical protein E2C01_011324 [Portunus trituberculatus]|uniref:Uncharacterized protein n=1 Tax=Portunus trituberculatus TaxID=210409 RepID=A0A5B7DB42_PORTR|nr:hypothetical protein [Portunus trituberculatus]